MLFVVMEFSNEINMALPLANGKHRKAGRLAVNLVGSLALAVWLFHFCLWYQYAGTCPNRPDASSGRVYPLNTHGSVAYLNKGEDSTLTGLTIATIGLVVVAFAINGIFVDGFSRNTMPWEKKRW
ncbi:MAG TPA: hypothetical protein VLY23_14495 [Candidatus Acidoferrum sp.]|nr:hypothetical protein [Candidatus Acidoferrum sp.]